MKVVYVVVSNANDTYYEQTCISAISLKKHNPRAQVYFLVDQDTARTFTGKRTLHEKLGVSVVTVDVPADLPNMQRSRFIKTSMNRWVEGSFFFIDGDTVVCDTLDGMDEKIDVGMVADGNTKFKQFSCIKLVSGQMKKLGFHKEMQDGNYYNSGFMWYSGSPRAVQLLQLWHELWLKGWKKVPFDQPYLNEANFLLKGAITELNGIWNCQMSTKRKSARFFYNAKILHYFASSGEKASYDLADYELQKTVLDEKHEKLDEILKNPKTAVACICDLNSDIQDMFFRTTPFYYNFRWCYENLHPLFCVCDFLCRCVFFVPKKLKRLVTGKQ